MSEGNVEFYFITLNLINCAYLRCLKSNSVKLYDHILNVVEALKEILHNLPDRSRSKIVFLMVLNTRSAVSEELKNDDLVCLFTNTLPYIEKEYLITYVYHLNLHQQLFRVIENCPGALSLELLGVIIKKLKEPNFHRDTFGIKHFYQLWESVFVKICKISSGLHMNDSCRPFMNYFQEIYVLIQEVLIKSMQVNGLESFVGFHLYSFFKSVLFFLQHRNLNLEDDSIYKLNIKFKTEDAEVLIDYVKVCNTIVFEKIFNVLENLTVDLWMMCSEIHFDFDPKNSAQLLIGGLVCSIIDEVKHIELPSDVVACLSNLAIKKSDLMAKAGIDEIIENVKNGDQDWFPALAYYQDFANKNFLECLLNHLHLASPDELNIILENSYEYLCSHEEKKCLDSVKRLFLKAVKRTPEPLYWLEKVFEKYQPELLTTADAHKEIIEVFNKISKEKSVSDCDLILLCMQMPLKMIKNICHMGVCGSHQTGIIIDILKLLKKPCNAFPEDGFTLLDFVLLKLVLIELTDSEKRPFINFIVELRKEKLLRDSFFINLLKTLKGFLESEMLERAVFCLEIVKHILDLKLFHVEEAAFLVFMSQVLGFFAWDLTDFSVVKAEGRDAAGSIVATVISRLCETRVAGPEFCWARKEILNSTEIVQAYFCELWFLHGDIWPGSGKIHSCILALAHSRIKASDLKKFLMAFDEPQKVVPSIITALSLVLPISTFQEWNCIFNQLIIISDNLNFRKSNVDVYYEIFDMFGSALIVLVLMSKLNRKVLLCYHHCLRNFGRLTGTYCRKITCGLFFRGTLKKFLFLIQTLEGEYERKICWEVCKPALIELFDYWIKKNKFDEADRCAVEEFLLFLNLEEEFAEIMGKKM